jgi:Fur family ferric uptake transcriptional regulator
MKIVVMIKRGPGEPQVKTRRAQPKREGSQPRDPYAEAKARVAAHLARAKLKRSRARDAVIDVFLASHGHASVEELTASVRHQAPTVGYTTVYRALKLLTECGLAAPRHFGDGQTRYEPVREGTHHDHMICIGCGDILEFEDDRLEQLQAEIASRHGFQLTHHRMELYGRCRRCQARERGGGRAPPRS